VSAGLERRGRLQDRSERARMAMRREPEPRRGARHEVSVSFAYDGCDLAASKGIFEIAYGKIFTLSSERPRMRKTWPAKFPRRRRTARGAVSLSLIVCWARNFSKKIFP